MCAGRDPETAVAVAQADVVFVAPSDERGLRTERTRIDRALVAAGRDPAVVRVLADIVVFLDRNQSELRERKGRLDGAAGGSDERGALVFTGTPAELAERLVAWQQSGYDGFRLCPAGSTDSPTRSCRCYRSAACSEANTRAARCANTSDWRKRELSLSRQLLEAAAETWEPSEHGRRGRAARRAGRAPRCVRVRASGTQPRPAGASCSADRPSTPRDTARRNTHGAAPTASGISTPTITAPASRWFSMLAP